MATVDEETLAAAKEVIFRQSKAGQPFFCGWNATRMHFHTHVNKENLGKSGQDEYSDGMVEHDSHVSESLRLLDELKTADDKDVRKVLPQYHPFTSTGKIDKVTVQIK